MSLYDVPRTAAQPPRFLKARWLDLRHAVRRWFDRERELVRLRVTVGMMAEARQGDAAEYHEFFERSRFLSERVRQLEEERDAWRNASRINPNADDVTHLGSGMADTVGVIRFTQEMENKMGIKRAQGRGGWNNPAYCSIEHLQALLRSHVEKGDPVDVANFAMMIWNRQHPEGKA